MKKYIDKLSKPAQASYPALVLVLLYTPIIVLMLLSVNKARFSLQWKGFSLQWYKLLLQDSVLWSAFSNSVILGVLSSGIATVIGIAACIRLFLYHCHRVPSAHPKTLYYSILLPIVIPDLIIAVGLLMFFNIASIPLGFFSLLIAHITFCIPFVVVTLTSRIYTVDPNIYFSAIDLGASRAYALSKIIFPILRPTIFSALLLAFTLSFDDVIISYFVAGPSFNILPLAIFSLVRAGITPELNALCTITFIVSMVLVIIAYRLSKDLR